jgi:nicotinamide riboside transporter PnuC
MVELNSDNNHVPTMLLVFSVVFSIIPTIAVALRLQAAGRTKSRLYWDDWTIILALVSESAGLVDDR